MRYRVHCAAVGDSRAPAKAFTLIEMLVVIAVIGILAALIVNLAPLANRQKVDKRVQAELAQMVTAIEAYKSKKGFYPQTNTNDYSRPPLFYELVGTRQEGNMYHTLDDKASIRAVDIPLAYGLSVVGFMNSIVANNADITARANDPDFVKPETFLKDIKDSNLEGSGQAIYLGVPVKGHGQKFSRWRYNAATPVYNPDGFDLWVEVDVRGGTVTNGNWKK